MHTPKYDEYEITILNSVVTTDRLFAFLPGMFRYVQHYEYIYLL